MIQADALSLGIQKGDDMYKGFIYNQSLYTNDLHYFAQKIYERIPKSISIMVSASSSGCALASAIIMLAQIQGRTMHNIYVRKEGEKSHGSRGVIIDSEKIRGEGIIVDDVLGTGKTLMMIVDYVSKNVIDLKITKAFFILDHRDCAYGEEREEFKEYLANRGITIISITN